MEEFISQNASAVFGLLGAFVGGLLSFLTSWALKNREYTLRIWDKLLERRIKAHENLIAIAIELRVMVALGGEGPDGEVARAPQVLISEEEFEKWFIRFTQLTQSGSTWLTTQARRELNFVQDYLVTLHTNLSSVRSERYLAVGAVIRSDFLDLSSGLEKAAYDYFENTISERKLGSLRDHHKFPRSETESRLRNTVLMQNWDRVQEAASIGQAM